MQNASETAVYPQGYGLVVVKGEIDMGIRWRARHVEVDGTRYFVNGEFVGNRDGDRYKTSARDLSGLPVKRDLGADDIWTIRSDRKGWL